MLSGERVWVTEKINCKTYLTPWTSQTTNRWACKTNTTWHSARKPSQHCRWRTASRNLKYYLAWAEKRSPISTAIWSTHQQRNLRRKPVVAKIAWQRSTRPTSSIWACNNSTRTTICWAPRRACNDRRPRPKKRKARELNQCTNSWDNSSSERLLMYLPIGWPSWENFLTLWFRRSSMLTKWPTTLVNSVPVAKVYISTATTPSSEKVWKPVQMVIQALARIKAMATTSLAKTSSMPPA